MGQKSSAGILEFLSSVGDLVKSDKLETIKFADKLGIILVFSKTRHFKH